MAKNNDKPEAPAEPVSALDHRAVAT